MTEFHEGDNDYKESLLNKEGNPEASTENSVKNSNSNKQNGCEPVNDLNSQREEGKQDTDNYTTEFLEEEDMCLDVKDDLHKKSSVNYKEIEEIISQNKEVDIPSKDLLWETLSLAVPTTLFFLCLFLQQTINLVFISSQYKDQEKDEAIDAIGISHLYVNCTLISIVIGILAGFEILGGNAWGSKNYRLLGVYYHRAFIVGLVLCVIIVTIHYFTAVTVLSLFNLTERTLDFVSQYIKIIIFIAFFDMQFSLNHRYINIIGKSYMNLVILLVALALHPLWCYIFIVKMELKIVGAGISLLISQIINSLLGSYYIYIIKPVPQSIFWFHKSSFCLKGLSKYFKIALPTAFLQCAEWWSFEILSVIALWCSQDDYTSIIIVNNIYMIVYTIVLGNLVATSIIVSKYVSAGKERVVRKLVKIILIESTLVALVASGLIAIFRREVLSLFKSEGIVFEKSMNTVLYWYVAATVFDSLQSIFCSIARGLRLHVQASVIAFINCYIFWDGSAIIFGKMLGFGVLGVFSSVAVGCMVSSVVYVWLLCRYDLEERIRHTQLCLHHDSKEIKERKDSIATKQKKSEHELI
mmetsp:Transcript_41709/g.43697  ORF Transcript_41709/g.43697 Transcript_41709/m.43697 type:complete len:582 (+) Transcript_41709:3-1748(+)